MRSLPIFTPSLATFDDLKDLFVVREKVLTDIVERVRAASTTAARNHTLLVGPRGSGKTHLISLAYHSVAELRAQSAITVQACWLPEDPWAISSYRRLLDSIVDRLEPAVDPTPRPRSAEEIEELLSRRCQELGPVVCFVENLDQILDAIGTDGQQRLRHMAQQRVFLFVASTTSLSRHLATQPAPFYGFFTTAFLEPFNVKQATLMLETIARHQGDSDVASYLQTEQAAGRLCAVAHLAGGQPRIWSLMGQALTVASLEQLVTLFLTQFDDLTPYYQEQLARLSPQQREIVVSMVELDHPVNVKELAEATGIEQRSLAKTLVELRERGWVTETNSPLTRLLDQRRTYYELGEPLVRLAFQLKASRGSPIPLIVEFLKAWFEPTVLAQSVAGDQLTAAYLKQATFEQEGDPILALSRRLYSLPARSVPLLDLIGRLDDACAQLEGGDPEPLLRMPSALRAVIEAQLPVETIDRSAIHAVRVRLHNLALDDFGFFRHPAGMRWIGRAETLITGPETRRTGSIVLADWLGRMWQFQEAEEILGEVESDGSADSIGFRFHLANSYQAAGRQESAVPVIELLIEQAERRSGDHTVTLLSRTMLAVTLCCAGRYSEAQTLAKQVASDQERLLDPNDSHAVEINRNLALVYRRAGCLDEAIALGEHVVRSRTQLLGAEHPNALSDSAELARQYRQAGCLDEAIALGEHVLCASERIFGSDQIESIAAKSDLANIYRAAGRVDDAIALGEEALHARERIFGSDHIESIAAKTDLAKIYRAAGRIDDAITLAEQIAVACEACFGIDHKFSLGARTAVQELQELRSIAVSRQSDGSNA